MAQVALHIMAQGLRNQDCSTVQDFLVFFVQTGAQEILIFVNPFVCPIQICLELSISQMSTSDSNHPLSFS